MPPALRVLDITNHGGTVMGPGMPTVLIGGMPAAIMLDSHLCPIPVVAGHGPGVFIVGSGTVLIGGKPALRITDACTCGAMGVIGEPTVDIGG
ncbi:MAG: PAAR domain-containing protein [Mucilaginibacter sp.]|nr:PAAR domain-containing protein [Mucilaginibacter sp.]